MVFEEGAQFQVDPLWSVSVDLNQVIFEQTENSFSFGIAPLAQRKWGDRSVVGVEECSSFKALESPPWV